MTEILQTRDLVKIYGTRRVVDRVSYAVREGEIVGLLGKNGAGKTTSFRMTVGMIQADEGAVEFLGDDVSGLPMYKRARLGIGYLSQEPSVFQRLTVEQNILAILETVESDRRERMRRLEDLLDTLELKRLRRSKANTLSGGERRRLEITRALVTTPRLILLDEPFSGVDPIAVQDIKDIIQRLAADGMAILMTDHNVRDTLSVTDRSYIINEGVILAEGRPEELVDNPTVRRTYLGEGFSMEFGRDDGSDSDDRFEVAALD